VVVKASPASTLIVIEAQFLLEFLIVALDPPGLTAAAGVR
jgi:hypothetical protein